MNTAPATRSLQRRVEINASPEDVWNAIATSDGISRWFTFETDVTPGEGGTIAGNWGPECGGTMKITAWEPQRRLQVTDDQFTPDTPQLMDYLIESSGGTTVLRIVHSGIGAEAKWDEMYDSVNRGWDVFMHTLRHSIERHPGKDRVIGAAACKPAMSRADAWKRLVGDEGLGVQREAEGDADFGRYSISGGGGGGGRLAGETWIWNPPKDLAGTVAELDDAVLWIALEGERPSLSMTLSAYGVAESRVRDVAASWQETLDRLFPANGS